MPWPNSAGFDSARNKYIYKCTCGKELELRQYKEEAPLCNKKGCGKRTRFDRVK